MMVSMSVIIAFNITLTSSSCEKLQGSANNFATDYAICFNGLQISINTITTDSTIWYNSSTAVSETYSKSVYSSDGEELDIETLQKSYQDLYGQWLKDVAKNKVLEAQVAELMQKKQDTDVLLQTLEEEVSKKDSLLKTTNRELLHANETIKKLTLGSTKLDHILSFGKATRDKYGLDCVDE